MVPGATATVLESNASLAAEKDISTYHVYHKSSFHYRLTSERDEYKDKVWPTISEMWAHMKEQREKRRQAKVRPQQPIDESAFFVHAPYISFKHPPRTLRLGQTKEGTPLCLIHNSWFWRRWQIQFCHGLDSPGVVDPRGVVGAEHSTTSVQGYHVRTWRLWGETGKKYHQSVNKSRKEGGQNNDEKGAPLDVTTAVNLTWAAPFTPRTREYHFRYENLGFVWKGTGTVRYPGLCGSFLRFNHLKLVVTVPTVDNEGTREVLLATYTSSPAAEKAGTLQICDDTLLWLLKTHVPTPVATLGTFRVSQDKIAGTSLEDMTFGSGHLAASQLYQCVVATAMCMIIAEHQKREWLRHVLELAAGEAGASAG